MNFCPNIQAFRRILDRSKCHDSVSLVRQATRKRTFTAQDVLRIKICFDDQHVANIRHAVDALRLSHRTIRWILRKQRKWRPTRSTCVIAQFGQQRVQTCCLLLINYIGWHSQKIVSRKSYDPIKNSLLYNNHQKSRQTDIGVLKTPRNNCRIKEGSWSQNIGLGENVGWEDDISLMWFEWSDNSEVLKGTA